MNIILLRKWVFLGIVMGLVPQISSAMSSTAEVNKEELTEPQHYSWYDGDEKRSVWANPKLMAEFNLQPETRVQLKSLYAAKEIDTPSPYVRFWEIKGDISTQAVARSLKGGASSHLSPVLYDSASISGMKRALPGNVLVQMKPDWSQEQIDAWFEAHDLIVVKPLTFAPNTFLIQTGSGLDSLETANRIYETGDVVLASPNWWQEMVAR